MSYEADELLNNSKNLGIQMKLLGNIEAENIIHKVYKKFSPIKTTNHISIGNNSLVLPLDKYEFNYMEFLPQESGYIFFEQYTSKSKNTVLQIENIQFLGKILLESFGMEYFLTNINMEYLISVNWYVIESVGKAKEILAEKIKNIID